jgi:hypothetical protein
MMMSKLMAVALSGVVAVTLTGCFQNPIEAAIENATEQAVEQAIEEAGEASGVDVDLGGGASLPEGWPASVPVPDGEIFSSLKQDDFYTVLMTVASEEVALAGAEAIKAAGFEVTYEQNVSGMRAWQLENADLTVNYQVITDGETFTVSIMVGPKTG